MKSALTTSSAHATRKTAATWCTSRATSLGRLRACLPEGRLTEEQMNNFRQEVHGNGLSSYPHPKLMPEFWQFPTVSMGLGPISAIYQAKFLKYLEHRGLKDTSEQRFGRRLPGENRGNWMMNETLDGDYQTFKSKDGAYVREHFFGRYPETAALVKDMTDDEIWALNRGGHDPKKIFAALKKRRTPKANRPLSHHQRLRHG